ncbi:hypothetical protein HII17_10540 [Thalassotalea sp. M1531]|uniref:Uncharacterized protein n=1 Tax=Thalassotalea algicola TaxID=2716224 RepID=A0A7Y0LF42_9GAMM|nr:hypothetical protein [Thalassotalea algicola]NMP32005.1 hypothetical protein [Thalassotalea algicola]
MPKKLLVTSLFALCLSGCAERTIDIIDSKGKVVGGCIAGYDWHLYGLQDSIDYMLYVCAKDSLAKGYTISDERLLTLDYTLPKPPNNEPWNKKVAMSQFHAGKITEKKLGYILAAIEYEYQKIVWAAEDDLANGKITQADFNTLEKSARRLWQGE